jgi:uncharacterized protein (TIGR02453 family)
MSTTTASSGLPGFSGFPARAPDFYAQLEMHNSRDWWLAHRDTYEAEVRAPMLALLDALEDEFGEAKVFRPNRDVRFSADKAPYKTHLGALVTTASGSGYYVELSASGLRAGGGFRAHGPGETARLRRAVDEDVTGPELEGLLASLVEQGFELIGEQVRTTPRGMPPTTPASGRSVSRS